MRRKDNKMAGASGPHSDEFIGSGGSVGRAGIYIAGYE